MALVVVPAFTVAMPARAQINVSSQMTVTSGSCKGCDFSNKTMPRLTLKQSNFSGSLFNRANLSGGHIIDSNLSGAHFKKAFLARIEGNKVNFSDARMEDSILTEAKLDQTLMLRADLRRADLSRAEMTNSFLNGADLSNVIAVGAQLLKSDFSNAKLDHADFLGAKLDDSIFNGVEFGNAQLKGTKLTRVNFSGANLSRVRGLTQLQLDVACGDAETQLPMGLNVNYCQHAENVTARVHSSTHAHMTARDEYVAARIDRAISDVESLMLSADAKTRANLQRVHANLMSARRKIEKTQ